MYIYTCAIVTVHICIVTIVVYTIILLISHFAHFFFLSLLRAKWTQCQTLLSSSYFSSDTQKHSHTDKPTERQIGAGVGRLWISGSVLVALDQSSWVDGNESGCLWINVSGEDWCLWVNENGFWCLWIGIGGEDQCLWVDWNKSLHVHLLLWVGACGGDGCLRQLKGRTQVEETWPRESGD